MSMLSDFLKEHQITSEAIVERSRALEGHDVKARAQMVARNKARVAKKTYAELNLDKVRSRGRGVSPALLVRALAGEPVSRLVRHKIVRAVNSQLLSAKKSEVDWRPLFADARVKVGKAKKTKK